jgi:hypothetical protein
MRVVRYKGEEQLIKLIVDYNVNIKLKTKMERKYS